MATIVQQQPQQESAARAFWNAKMQERPNLAGGLAIAGEVVGYFVNFHFLVALGRWVLRVGGYIAETALLFAVLWISGTSVAPGLVELVMSEKTMQYFVSVAVVALALIPEIILANAIINALRHVHTASQQKMVVGWIWAGLFTLPTLLFLILTAVTLNRLTSNGGNFVEASKDMLGLRCFAGWTYGLLEMVYAGVGRHTIGGASAQVQVVNPTAQPVPQPAIQIDYQELARHLLPLVREEVKTLLPAPVAVPSLAPVADGQRNQLLQELATVKEMVSQVKGSVIQSDQIEQVFAQLTSQQSGEVVDKEVDNHEVTFPPQEDEVVDSEDDKEEVVSAPADDTEDDTRSALSDDVLADVSMQSNLDQRPRITVKLQDDVVSTKRRVKSATKPSTPNDRGQARQKALRVLKRNPTLKPAELAEKAGISRQYASKIVSEQTV